MLLTNVMSWWNVSVTPSVIKPTVAIGDVTSVSYTSATVAGNVTADGGATVTERGICYGTSANPDTVGTHVTSGSGTGAFSANLTGLTAGTTYYVRAYATNTAGIGYSTNATFSTTAITVPTVTTGSVTNITQTSAAVAGNVTANGGATVTARGICYGTSQNPTISGSKVTSGSGTGSFAANLTGLTAGTTYYVRAYATNSAGTAYGSQTSFATAAAPSGEWTLLYEKTTSGTATYNITGSYSEIGFFVVGGGGGGKGDFSKNGRGGNGGNGGQARSWSVNFSSTSVSVTVGAGGTGGIKNSNSIAGGTGGNSSVTYNGNTYTANGGTGGIGSSQYDSPQTKQEYSGCGGRAMGSNAWAAVTILGKAGEGESFVYSNTTYANTYYANGGDGIPDPFSTTDTNKYGAGGGGGTNSYSGVTSYHAVGGTNGGGSGGYGSQNTSTNRGTAASVAGAGGGGAAYSSKHTYGQGGAGAAGMVRIYGR